MYRIEWIQSALNELATAWLKADAGLRYAITAAAHSVDQELRIDPGAKGESRERGGGS